MALAKRNEGAKVSSDINVTPMVDVMLVLLIIFMVVTPMLQKGVSVDMAKVDNPDADGRCGQRRCPAGLHYSRRQGLFRYRADHDRQLDTKVKDRLANKPDKRVYVKADMRTRFGGVVQVVDSVRAAGVDDLGLLTDQRKTGPAAPPAPAAPAPGQ